MYLKIISVKFVEFVGIKLRYFSEDHHTTIYYLLCTT